ncbi:spermiogenesis-related protein stanley-cup [Leptinotarsa decemlineata]|uniref:spermiogenesis-related protein stanley-cup n=1 Tax=Leptinotarsa decemlineata TaxID=7539 RepID=UPI003D309A34
MKKLAILTAIQNNGGLNSTEMNPSPGSPPAPVHGVNVMLGGAMISGILLVLFILCYCCNKTNRKSPSHLDTYWRDPGLSMEIYTVESAQNWLVSEDLSSDIQRPPTPGPPPAYEVVVPPNKIEPTKEDETGLPSYESAVKHLKGWN